MYWCRKRRGTPGSMVLQKGVRGNGGAPFTSDLSSSRCIDMFDNFVRIHETQVDDAGRTVRGTGTGNRGQLLTRDTSVKSQELTPFPQA